MGRQSYLTSADEMTLGIALRSQDYGWTEPLTERRYILTNPEDVMKFDVFTLMANFRESGHAEWEAIWAWFLKQQAGEAIATGERCDISPVFNRDYLSCNKGTFTREMVWKHIGKFFRVDSETEDEVILTLKTK